MFVYLSLSSFLDEQNRYCYDVYEFTYNIVDSWKQFRQCTISFYVVKFTKLDIIFDMFMLIEHNIVLNSQTINWRFKINFEKLKIKKFKKFVKTFKKQNQIFALICVDVT